MGESQTAKIVCNSEGPLSRFLKALRSISRVDVNIVTRNDRMTSRKASIHIEAENVRRNGGGQYSLWITYNDTI